MLTCAQLAALETALTTKHTEELAKAVATERASAAKALAIEKQKAEETLHQVRLST